jgi:hypothetical protein
MKRNKLNQPNKPNKERVKGVRYREKVEGKWQKANGGRKAGTGFRV